MEDGAKRKIHPDRPGTFRRIAFTGLAAARMARRCVLIAAGVIFVVVPFGYAASGDYVQVVRGAGYGLVVAASAWRFARTVRNGRATIAVPLAVFLVARAAALWLDPRLLIYGQLAAYLRVMWVPIGGFAVGYLVIIVLFAGFYGMLAHFSPGAFTGVGEEAGIMTWVSFAFFTGVGRDYSGIVPVSAGAQALVGAQLIPSIGWALVVFAAVMVYIQPQLERIARRAAERQGD